jgi:putative transposase
VTALKTPKNKGAGWHKIANVLDKLPKRLQPKAKELLHEMMRAETKADAEKDRDHFEKLYCDKYPKAVECLTKKLETINNLL